MADIVATLKAYRLPPPIDREARIHASYYPTALIDEAAAEIERLRRLVKAQGLRSELKLVTAP